MLKHISTKYNDIKKQSVIRTEFIYDPLVTNLEWNKIRNSWFEQLIKNTDTDFGLDD